MGLCFIHTVLAGRPCFDITTHRGRLRPPFYLPSDPTTSLTDTEHNGVPTLIGFKGGIDRQCLLTMHL
jgi:hypothetical protein